MKPRRIIVALALSIFSLAASAQNIDSVEVARENSGPITILELNARSAKRMQAQTDTCYRVVYDGSAFIRKFATYMGSLTHAIALNDFTTIMASALKINEICSQVAYYHPSESQVNNCISSFDLLTVPASYQPAVFPLIHDAVNTLNNYIKTSKRK